MHNGPGIAGRVVGRRVAGATALLLSAVVGAALTAGSSEARTAAPHAVTRTPYHAYDGATLVRGVYFGQGPVASLLPEIWAGQPKDAARRSLAERQADVVVAALSRRHPEVLAELAGAVASHNRERIAAAVDAGRVGIEGVLREVQGQQTTARRSGVVAFCDEFYVLITNPTCGTFIYYGLEADISRAPLARDLIADRLAVKA